MDKETREAIETRDGILDAMRQEIDSLTGLLADFKKETGTKIEGLEKVQSSLQDSLATSQNEPDPDAAALHEQAVEENARLNEQIGDLNSRIAFLESPDHNATVVQNFLRSLDKENYFGLGAKLGFLEEARQEDIEKFEGSEEQSEPYEVPLGDNKVMLVQKTKPEDTTGWELSETQGLWIKVKPEE